jgi:hypothetical protein
VTLVERDEILASKKPYICVSEGMSGHYAVLVVWNEECGGFYEPQETGCGRYETRADAIEEAQSWAKSEGVPYVCSPQDLN